jgi:hypothetical protein
MIPPNTLMVSEVATWPPALDRPVNKRDLSTGETREFASENVGFGLNRGG